MTRAHAEADAIGADDATAIAVHDLQDRSYDSLIYRLLNPRVLRSQARPMVPEGCREGNANLYFNVAAGESVHASPWEQSRYDCKEQRDEHIRRYAELLEQQRDLNSRQIDAKLKTENNPKGAGRKEGVAAKIADEIGLVRR